MYNNSYNSLASSYVAEMLKGVTIVKIVEGEIGMELSGCSVY